MKITVWLKKDFGDSVRKDLKNVVKVQMLPSGKLNIIQFDVEKSTFIDWTIESTEYDGFCQWSDDDVLVEEYFQWKDKQGAKK